MTTKLWLSYDLGIKGDYENLYCWLDEHGAKECGDSVAIIPQYQFEGDLIEHVKKDLQNNVGIREKDRIYLFATRPKTIARFILGKRKRAPWEGFASGNIDETDV